MFKNIYKKIKIIKKCDGFLTGIPKSNTTQSKGFKIQICLFKPEPSYLCFHKDRSDYSQTYF